MKVTAEGATYVALPEEAKLSIYDRISLTLYRTSMFHKKYDAYRLTLSPDELKELRADERAVRHIGLEKTIAPTFKGVTISIEDDFLP